MSKDTILACLRQGEGPQEIIMEVEISVKLADKMGEIRSRNPQEWEYNDFNLLFKAKEELGLPLK